MMWLDSTLTPFCTKFTLLCRESLCALVMEVKILGHSKHREHSLMHKSEKRLTCQDVSVPSNDTQTRRTSQKNLELAVTVGPFLAIAKFTFSLQEWLSHRQNSTCVEWFGCALDIMLHSPRISTVHHRTSFIFRLDKSATDSGGL